MSLNAAAGISAVLGVPLAAIPVGFTIHGTLQSLRPKSKLKKWSIRIEQISAVVASKGDMITTLEMEKFLRLLELYMKERDSLRQRIEDGTCTWYGKGKEHVNGFSLHARETWENGVQLSTDASKRRARSYLPKNAAQVPTTNTSESPLNKGESRQASSLSEESPLKHGPHSIDTAKSSESEPSTGMSDSSSSSCQCLPKLPPSTSLPPLYSEAVSNGARRVNSEDDSGSDSESDNMALEKEVEALYDLWRQMPEEEPEASTTSLLAIDKLLGVMTIQKL